MYDDEEEEDNDHVLTFLMAYFLEIYFAVTKNGLKNVLLEENEAQN